jgi:hypothetical protein
MSNAKFNADISNIGEWMGDEETAIREWNKTVAPALRDLYAKLNDSGDDAEAICASAQQAAYERFCLGEINNSECEPLSQAAEAAETIVRNRA